MHPCRCRALLFDFGVMGNGISFLFESKWVLVQNFGSALIFILFIDALSSSYIVKWFLSCRLLHNHTSLFGSSDAQLYFDT